MRALLATACSTHAEIARDLVAEAVGPDQHVAAAARAEQCPEPRSASRSGPDVVVRFFCAREEHLANPVPGGPGLLVSHHGTFGYCSARVAEGHAWKDIHRVTLSDLEHHEPEGTGPRRGDVRLCPWWHHLTKVEKPATEVFLQSSTASVRFERRPTV